MVPSRVTIPESVGSLFVTDKAWNGTDFVTDEGTLEVCCRLEDTFNCACESIHSPFLHASRRVLQYSIPAGGVSADRVFAYGVQFPDDKGTWEIVDDSTFDLQTTAPDNILIYCLNADDKPNFLHALVYSNDGFKEAGAATYNVSETSMPESLTLKDGALALPFAPNYLYEGVREGDRTELVAAFSDPANYKGSNTPYNIVTSAAVAVFPPVLASLVASIVAAVAMVIM